WQHLQATVVTARGKKLFTDIRLRQALFYAIDRQSIVNGQLEGTVSIANTAEPANSPYYNPDVMVYDYSPDKAKQLLDAAGWTLGSDGIRSKDGEKLSITALISSADSLGKLNLQVIQQNFKSV